MTLPPISLLVLITLGSAMMLYVVLSAIGKSALALASDQIMERRAAEARRQEMVAAAEAVGRAAALEPLALNPDGTVEEPIIGVVESSLG